MQKVGLNARLLSSPQELVLWPISIQSNIINLVVVLVVKQAGKRTTPHKKTTSISGTGQGLVPRAHEGGNEAEERKAGCGADGPCSSSALIFLLPV